MRCKQPSMTKYFSDRCGSTAVFSLHLIFALLNRPLCAKKGTVELERQAPSPESPSPVSVHSFFRRDQPASTHRVCTRANFFDYCSVENLESISSTLDSVGSSAVGVSSTAVATAVKSSRASRTRKVRHSMTVFSSSWIISDKGAGAPSRASRSARTSRNVDVPTTRSRSQALSL